MPSASQARDPCEVPDHASNYAANTQVSQDKLELLKHFWQCVRDAWARRCTTRVRSMVVDPANPTNNVADYSDWHEWQQYVERICGDSGLRQFIRNLTA